jgi:DNA-binding NarL/FixJ family response regulator
MPMRGGEAENLDDLETRAGPVAKLPRGYRLTMAHHIIIIDDHPLFRGALRQTLQDGFGDVRIDEGGSLDALTAMIESATDVDLILLDLTMPGLHGFSGLIYLRAQAAHVPVVVVSANDNPEVVRRCIEFGASGFIPKSLPLEQMREALTAVLAGKLWLPPDISLDGVAVASDTVAARLATLTPQQVKVLMMLGEGLLNKQIAFQLSVSEATVKAHVSAILHKLGVDSRTQAVIAINRIENLDLGGGGHSPSQ